MQYDLATVAHVNRLGTGSAVVEMPPLVGKVAVVLPYHGTRAFRRDLLGLAETLDYGLPFDDHTFGGIVLAL